MPLADQSEFINLLMEQNRTVLAQNEELTKTVSELTAKIDELTQKITELTEQKNKNSNNSSKPPSSDGLKKPNKETSLREKTGKKQGGQPEHSATNLVVNEKPTDIKLIAPSKCQSCPMWEKCKGKACEGKKRSVIDIEIKKTITEYCSLEITCPKDNQKLKGEFPKTVKGRYSYGNTIAAFLVALNTVGAVSTDRIKEIVGSIFNLPVGKGTIVKMVSRFKEKAEPALKVIKELIEKSSTAHFDETGSRVEGKTRWIHNASTFIYTYLCYSHNRGFKGMEDADVLPNFKGIAHHDCWSPYWKFKDIDHAICCAHLLRELNGIIENHPEQKWAEYFKILLLNMKHTKEVSISNGEEYANKHYLEMYDKQYDDILQSAYEMNPLPEPETSDKRGRKKKGKIRALIERLDNYKGAVCLFFNDFKVEFDNNQAERDLRMIKVKTKVSGCFRSEDGIRDYLAVMSYVGTAKKHGKNAFQAILNVFEGNVFYALED